MDRIRITRTALAGFFVVAALTSGCAPAHQPASTGASGASSPQAATSTGPNLTGPSTGLDRPVRQGGTDHGSPAAAAGLPADWPQDLPVPGGAITGSTGSAGRWTLLILAVGSADRVRRSAVALYSAAGFTPATDSVLNKGNRQITLVVENRDHSATSTSLAIGVTTR